MKRPIAFVLLACAGALALSPAFAQPRAVEYKSPVVARAVSAPRPIVIVGGWSNCPAHFTSTSLVRELRASRGEARVLLTTHADPWGDVDANARAEAAQIVGFLDRIGGVTEFDLVGFSMGGLVARSMVLKNAASLGRYKVANLVTMATPNHGANPFLTNIDPGVALGFSNDACASSRGPVQWNGNTASRQMAPDSDFLRDLNARQIPASIRVTTIAGNVEVDVVQPSVEREVAPTLCNANCSPFGPPALAPSNPGLSYVDQWHGACRMPNGSCSKDTQCPSHQEKFSDGGVWKCRAKVATPTTTTKREAIASDAFIRVASVRLSPSEAANIAAQHVFSGVYHTQGTENQARGGPRPKALMNANGVAPTNPGTPVMGTAVDGSWFFEDSRVTDVLKGLGR
jgi:pimeloyl-ACP methyl ester carboxylesterase